MQQVQPPKELHDEMEVEKGSVPKKRPDPFVPARGLECLEVRLDDHRNETCRPDCDVASCDSHARILVIHTREDLMIARQARQLIADGEP